MTVLLIAIIWAHLGFVLTLGSKPKRNAIGRSHRWRYVLGSLAAGPIVWLLALGGMLRSSPRLSHH